MKTRNVPPYYLVRLGQLQESFNSQAAQFAHIMSNGGGIESIQMGETIKELNDVFSKISAYLAAARDINNNVSLRTGLQALALVRSITAEEQAEKEQQVAG